MQVLRISSPVVLIQGCHPICCPTPAGLASKYLALWGHYQSLPQILCLLFKFVTSGQPYDLNTKKLGDKFKTEFVFVLSWDINKPNKKCCVMLYSSEISEKVGSFGQIFFIHKSTKFRCFFHYFSQNIPSLNKNFMLFLVPYM